MEFFGQNDDLFEFVEILSRFYLTLDLLTNEW